MNAAEQLFERLLREEKLISYIDAYELLLGTRPRPFWNKRDCRPVLRLALQTSPRDFRGLLIQLDALIVGRARNRPGEGHFRGKTYTEADWLRVFEGWPLY
jgi:hypothetical protein